MARLDEPDARGFCDLFNSLYSRKVNEAYYRWQFFSTPFPSGLAVATTADGKWAGCYGFHMVPSTGGCSPIAWMLDIMVAPEFQRKGVFRQLAAFAAECAAAHKPAALCVMANAKADLAHTHLPGWKRMMEISTFERKTADVPEMSGKFEFRFSEEIDSGVLAGIAGNAIAEKLTPRLVTQVRSESYFRWRFAENAWYRYSMLMISQAGADVAAVVVKSFQDPQSGESFGDVVDVVWDHEDPFALRELLCAALRHFGERGTRNAAIWLQTKTVLDSVGRELGFLESGQKRYFCGRVLDSNCGRLESAANWFLTMSAAEIF